MISYFFHTFYLVFLSDNWIFGKQTLLCLLAIPLVSYDFEQIGLRWKFVEETRK